MSALDKEKVLRPVVDALIKDKLTYREVNLEDVQCIETKIHLAVDLPDVEIDSYLCTGLVLNLRYIQTYHNTLYWAWSVNGDNTDHPWLTYPGENMCLGGHAEYVSEYVNSGMWKEAFSMVYSALLAGSKRKPGTRGYCSLCGEAHLDGDETLQCAKCAELGKSDRSYAINSAVNHLSSRSNAQGRDCITSARDHKSVCCGKYYCGSHARRCGDCNMVMCDECQVKAKKLPMNTVCESCYEENRVRYDLILDLATTYQKIGDSIYTWDYELSQHFWVIYDAVASSMRNPGTPESVKAVKNIADRFIEEESIIRTACLGERT